MLFQMLSTRALLGAALSLLSAGASNGETLEDSVNRLMEVYDEPGVPGASVGIFKSVDILLEKSYGLRDLEQSARGSVETNYRIASLSKAFTATAVMQLIESGRLDLNTRLADVFPDFPEYGVAIRVRHLLSHTSGIKDYEPLVPPNSTRQVTDGDVLRMLKNERSGYFTPGSQFRYSNSGYAVLACIVEAVSGIPFQQYLKQFVFDALGMGGSVAYVKGQNYIQERAYGYSPVGAHFKLTDQSPTSAVLGDGGIYSSVVDLHRWFLMWTGGVSLLSQESMRTMTTRSRLNDGRMTDYGFGWFIGTYKGHTRISHTGSTIGQRHAFAYYPDKKLGIVILVNRENATPWSTLDQIANLLL